jgi:hypothetical protein
VIFGIQNATATFFIWLPFIGAHISYFKDMGRQNSVELKIVTKTIITSSTRPKHLEITG